MAELQSVKTRAKKSNGIKKDSAFSKDHSATESLVHENHESREPVGRSLDFLARVTLAVAVAYLIYQVWLSVSSALFPVVTALILSYLLMPFVRLLQKKGLSKEIAVITVLLTLFIILSGFSVVLYPVLAREVRGVVEQTPVLINVAQENLPGWITYLHENYGIVLPGTVSEAMTEYGENLKSSVPGMLNQTGSWAFSALIKTGGILSGALNIILVPIFVIFFLLGHDTMINFLESLIPPRNRKSAQVFFRKLDGVATSWFRGQIEVLLILALVYGTGLGLVFGLSGFGVLNGFAVGALTGVLNIIPYVGIATGFILAMAMTLIEWNGIGPVIGVAAVYGIAQIADGYFITPRIVGTKVGLSTLWVLIALLVGGALAGFLGMLFAVPVAALIGAAWPDVVKFYRSTDFYNKE